MKTHIYDFNKRFGTTHKRTGIEEYVNYALDSKADTISVISSGNLLMELKNEIDNRSKKINLVNLVNKSYKKFDNHVIMEDNIILRNAKEREDYIKEFGSTAGINYGKVVDVTDFIPKAYETEAERILESKPDYVSVPIGSGKNFISIYNKIKDKNLDTKLIGFMPKGANGVFTKDLFEKNGNLFFKKLRSKSKADKLITPFMLEEYRQQILQARKEGHILYEMTPSEENKAIKESKKYPIKTEPSSSTAFYVLNKNFVEKHNLQESSIVVVNTGQGMKELNIVNIPISPLEKVIKGVVKGMAGVAFICLLNALPQIKERQEDKINQKMKDEFYNRYHPRLLVNGKTPLMGISALDYIHDEREAFVFGNTENLVYLSKERANELAIEGKKARKKF